MKKLFFTALALAAAFSISACSRVPAGNVGVKVYLLGGEKGVDTEELSPGRYWISINEELYLFPTFTQNYVWTRSETEGSSNDESMSFQTSEGLVVGADIGISYSINPNKVSTIFEKYRKGIDEITDIYLRNMVRDALVTEGSNRAIQTVYGSGKADLLKDVEAVVRTQVDPLGINIERIYWIGELRLPETVTESINAKIKATQQAQQRQNEVAESIAEAEKAVEKARGDAQSRLIRAEAEAKSNEVISKSLTPELVSYMAVQKWTGDLPRFTGGGALPFINIDEPNKAERDK